MTTLIATLSNIVGYLPLSIVAVLLYGNIVLALRVIKKTRKGMKASYRRIFTLKTLDGLPIVSLGTLVILVWLSPFGIPNLEERIRVAYEFGAQIERPVTVITHAFVHPDLDHFLGNALILLSFGVNAELQQGKRWQLATIAFAMPLGILAIFLSEFLTGREPEKPILGSSIFLYAMIVVSVSGIARYCLDRIRGDSSYVTVLATAVITTVVISVVDTNFLTDWNASHVGHFLGLTAGMVMLSVRAICGSRDLDPDTRRHLDELSFVYEKRWKSLSVASRQIARAARSRFSTR